MMKTIKRIPFVMIACLNCATWPLSAKNQALNALGKSGTNLIINFSLKFIGLGLLFACIPFGVYIMCLSSLLPTCISFLIYAFLIRKELNYSIKEQIIDILPIYAVGLVMFGVVYFVAFILNINLILHGNSRCV